MGIVPEQIPFEYGAHGKPTLPGNATLRFKSRLLS